MQLWSICTSSEYPQWVWSTLFGKACETRVVSWWFVPSSTFLPTHLTDKRSKYLHRCLPWLCICGVSERYRRPTLDGSETGLTTSKIYLSGTVVDKDQSQRTRFDKEIVHAHTYTRQACKFGGCHVNCLACKGPFSWLATIPHWLVINVKISINFSWSLDTCKLPTNPSIATDNVCCLLNLSCIFARTISIIMWTLLICKFMKRRSIFLNVNWGLALERKRRHLKKNNRISLFLISVFFLELVVPVYSDYDDFIVHFPCYIYSLYDCHF